MATMVKEKRREKKKTKQKHEPKPVFIAESTSAANLPIVEEIQISKVAEVTLGDESKSTRSLEDKLNSETVNVIEKEINLDSDAFSKEEEAIPPETGPKEILCKETNVATEAMPSAQSANAPDHAYTDLNLKLEKMCIPVNPVPVSKEREFSMEAESAYLVKEVTDQVDVSASVVPLSSEILMDNASAHIVSEIEDISPSAPTLEYSEPQVFYQEEVIAPEVPKLTSLPLEEAIRVYGGAEMAEVMAMSEREEAIVEAGDMSGPEHPLVDFLSTFKRSLIALERERIQLSVSFAEEEKYRNSLWKIEKQYINHYEKCKCGEGIFFKATYEHAEFQKDKLPVARMKLESIMRDVQDSYCLHQHSALLAHCQIEEFISEVVVRNKSEIREALSLVLQALKLSDNAPGVLSSALRRWAAALAAALVDRRDPRQLLFLLHHLFRCVLHSDVTRCSERHALGVLSSALRRWAAALAAALVDRRDPRQLLFLLHHLFRQTRSVRWAASVVDLSAPDHVSAARVIALLDVLLTRPPLECAVECTEDKDEEWEEVGKDGGGGAVSDGSLRERDMLALLRAFPLRELVARLALVTQADISQSREWQWGDTAGGRDVLRACFGARALLDVLCRAARAHAHYARLRRALRHVALCVLRALAAVHEGNWHKDLEVPIQAELEAAFVAGLDIMPPSDAHRLPASLLSWHAARDYCSAHIDNLHGAKPVRVESLSLALPALECGARVVAVASAAGGRRQDLDLARLVLEFLFQTGVRRNTASCKGACRQAARDALPSLLQAHPHLYEVALRHVADTSQVEKLEPSSISCLAVDRWRPQPHEAYDVALDWSQRCPHLLPALLLNLDYTPHTGISLDAQLGLGGWLCSHVRSLAPAEPDDWCWRALRALRLHRACWGLRPEAPPPDPEPDDLFSKAYALMQSSWGHCIPLVSGCLFECIKEDLPL